jgi:hypothetical protein
MMPRPLWVDYPSGASVRCQHDSPDRITTCGFDGCADFDVKFCEGLAGVRLKNYEGAADDCAFIKKAGD